MPTETTIIVERDIDGETHELEITVTGRVFGGDPGRTYGPPENCREPESAEVLDIKATYQGAPFELTDDELDTADEALLEQAGDDAEDAWGDLDDEPDYEPYD